LIRSRFEEVSSSDDFLADEAGLKNLDSISMRLIAIGEGFKQVDKLTNHQLLAEYPDIEWKNIKGIRDVLSHHYFNMDAEVIYRVCEDHLEALLDTTWDMVARYEIPNETTLNTMREVEQGIGLLETTLDEIKDEGNQ